MKRFEQLEFDQPGPTVEQGAKGEPIRNADFFYQQAQTAWLAGEVANLELDLTNGTNSLVLDGDVKLRDAMPSPDIADITTMDVPFSFVSATSDAAAFTITYTSDDVNP